MRTLKRLTFALAALFVAVLLARLAVALSVQPELSGAAALSIIVFVGVFLVTFGGILCAGMAFMVETSLTRHEKPTPDRISWNWY